MNKIKYILLLILMNSCFLVRENGIDIEIKNNSKFPITNVKFYTTEKLTTVKFEKIKPNETVSDFLSMKNNKLDGSYVLEFTRTDGKKEHRGGGYYTNGGSLDKNVKFSIESDTTLVKFSGTGY